MFNNTREVVLRVFKN